MTNNADQPAADPTEWVRVQDETETYHEHHLRVVRAELQYRRSDGQLSDPQRRLCVHRGDAVGVLVYDPSDRTVGLVRQFRYPAYTRLAPDERAQGAWLLEVVAGVQEQGQTPEETARRELSEEIGYDVSEPLEHIATVFSSPGFLSERVAVYLAEVTAAAQRGQGGGLAEEGEDTSLVRLPADEAWAMVQRGEICDAKTVIALQHLRLRLVERDNPSQSH